MSIKIAINGFGRIGRLVLRTIIENDIQDFSVVAINDLADAKTLTHLLKYDSVHGRLSEKIERNGNELLIGRHNIKFLSHSNPEELPWKEMDVDIVMECTGIYLTKEGAGGHIKAGAKQVLLSAPAKDDIKTVVYGINNNILHKDDIIVSNASCTTNALAPIVKVLHDHVGIQSGFMTTIHAYTGDQPLQDGDHKDLYRGRAAAVNIVPTTTGAAQAIGKVIPELKGVLNGVALRVPVPNVSAIDLSVVLKRDVDEKEIKALFKAASNGVFKDVLGYEEAKLVSSDMNHDAHSSTVVADQIYVQSGTLVRVFSWYDNEWGFSNRMIDTARMMFACRTYS